MTPVKRYRRRMTRRALKRWSPIFTLDSAEVDAALVDGRL